MSHVRRAPDYDLSSIGDDEYSSPIFPAILDRDFTSATALRSVVLQAPVTVSAVVNIPDSSVLDFSYGFVPDRSPVFPAELSLRFSDPKSGSTFEKTIHVSGDYSDRWIPVRVPLPSFGGRVVRIEISLTSNVEEPFHLLLGEPLILSRRSRDASARPNIVLVSIDTFRGGHSSAAGYDRATTPFLERICSEGVFFSRAFSQSGLTLPSHKSLLSGYYPEIFSYFSDSPNSRKKRLTGEIDLFTSLLKERGYLNVAFTGGGFLSAAYGWHREFDSYTQLTSAWHSVTTPLLRDRPVKRSGFSGACEWIRQNSEMGPFLLFLHTYAPHYPYAPPPKYDEYFHVDRDTAVGPFVTHEYLTKINFHKVTPTGDDVSRIVDVYDRGLRWVDDELKSLYSALEETGVLEDTILVVTSDHGEEFMEHGLIQHKMLYSTGLHVPLAIRWPRRFPRGATVDREVELVSLVPTLAEALDIEPRNSFHGESLLPLIDDTRATKEGSGFEYGSQAGWIVVRLGDMEYHMKALDVFVTVTGLGKMTGVKRDEMLFDRREDPTLENDLLKRDFPRDVYTLLKLQAFYYVAQNHPGWNVLLWPEDGATYSVVVSGLKEPEHLEEIGREFEWRGRDFAIFANKLRARSEGYPILMTFEGEPDEDLAVSIEKIVDGRKVHVSKIGLGLKETKSASSPVEIEGKTVPSDVPSLASGVDRELLDDFDALIWRTHFQSARPTPMGIEQEDLPEETVKQLRALGYVD